jgi:hypothetical protein
MRKRSTGIPLAFYLALAPFLGGTAHAQTIERTPNIALKSGESFELGNAYYISYTCKSLLTSTPEVEILDGPPGITVTVKEAMVIPHQYNCAKPVRGGRIIITAKEIEDEGYARLTLRYKFKTRDGERQSSQVYNVSLFPKDIEGQKQ